MSSSALGLGPSGFHEAAVPGDDLTIDLDSSAAAQVADQVPVKRALVLAACPSATTGGVGKAPIGASGKVELARFLLTARAYLTASFQQDELAVFRQTETEHLAVVLNQQFLPADEQPFGVMGP